MAYKNKLIQNTKTGQDIRFLQTAKDTNGHLLEMQTTYRAASKEPPLHYHPYQDEEFQVLQGEINVRIGKELKVLKAGESLHISQTTAHSMWNPSDKKAIVNWKVYPALNTEHFLETAVGVVVNGKTNSDAMPPLLEVALMVNKYSKVFRLAKPPFAVQKFLFALITPVAYLCGYRPDYKKYLD
jgi:quercetin dioxygenase-like cupin family protein